MKTTNPTTALVFGVPAAAGLSSTSCRGRCRSSGRLPVRPASARAGSRRSCARLRWPDPGSCRPASWAFGSSLCGVCVQTQQRACRVSVGQVCACVWSGNVSTAYSSCEVALRAAVRCWRNRLCCWSPARASPRPNRLAGARRGWWHRVRSLGHQHHHHPLGRRGLSAQGCIETGSDQSIGQPD